MNLDVKRVELKYRISQIQALRLRIRIAPFLQWDVHNGSRGYLVRSLYFDTLRDSDFEEKLDGYDPRQKIRLRLYDAGGQTAKLELKEKQDGRQRKRSLHVGRDAARELSRGRYDVLRSFREPLAEQLYLLLKTRVYRPKCVVQYRRIAYQSPDNDIRLTFDSEVCATEARLALFDPELPLYPVDRPQDVTLEVKYNGFLFSNLKQALGDAMPVAESISKYCMARRITKHGRI